MHLLKIIICESIMDKFDELIQLVKATELWDKSGAVLYSQRNTLCEGKMYILGYNPGGNPNVASSLPNIGGHLLKSLNSDGKNEDHDEEGIFG